jgi:ABC-type polysaccharide/polyol phosphate transport system ATPase subunit
VASVKLEDIVVDFPVYGVHKSFRWEMKQMIARTGGLVRRDVRHQRRITIRALDRVSVDIEHGERLGIVGHNGSGKSTLLRVIAGIYAPAAGRLSVEGTLCPLFNTAPGLDMDDTGYENIMSCGLYLGMTRDEILRKIPDMEEFAELGNFLSLPVRTYSSGMMVRLMFAIGTSIDPDILILDEGIGAGDPRFIERASKRVDALISRASILVLASQSDALIRRFCTRGMLLHGGRAIAYGPIDEILDRYKELGQSIQPGAPDVAGQIQNVEAVI